MAFRVQYVIRYITFITEKNPLIFRRVSSVHNVTVKIVRTKLVFSYLVGGFHGNHSTVLTVTTFNSRNFVLEYYHTCVLAKK